jgi:DNA-binding helix-hairpin-helix protein with protein kinase domain
MLFDSRGNQVQLGHELGRGGEGAVYETPGKAGMVAKVYLAAPDAKKQEKLSFMARTADASLLKYAAWPQDTLHKVKGGPAVGFLMGKVTGNDPIHMVYGPKHRRQKMPNIGWDFLLFVARNTAAAFETLHAHGHVLGDVNQGNVMVGGDSQVILIDSDSYQIRARDAIHFCEVGVSHFTPPELQGISSFRNVTRSSNHDNFGLALLIFHLLFGGRHPYSGVPLRKGVGDSLESDIKSLHYAYARDSQARGITSPPGSIPLSMVPDAIESMFHQAFTEGGVKGGRPTSAQWVQALDVQRKQLKKCGVSRTHVFPIHLSSCPWCALEQKGIVYFIDLGITFTQAASGFVMAQVWARIMSAAPPAAPAIPDPSSYSPAGKPVTGVAAKKGNTLAADLTIGACVLLFFFFTQAWFVWGGVIWLAVANRKPSEPPERIAERAARRQVEEQAQRTYDHLVTRIKQEAGPEGFLAKRSALEKLKTEYEQLSQTEARELEQLKTTANERQKQKFLDGLFIDAADIPGVGPGRKTALRSFGIETAADVSRNAVMQVKGFGPNLTRAVTDWRASCERRFTFNPSTAVTEADRNVVRVKYVARRRSIEGLLAAAPAELSGFTQTAVVLANQLKAQAANAASALAKAKADLAMLA